MFEQHNTPDKLWGCMEAMSEVADDEMRPFEQGCLTDEEMNDKRELIEGRILKISKRLARITEGDYAPDEITYSEISSVYALNYVYCA